MEYINATYQTRPFMYLCNPSLSLSLSLGVTPVLAQISQKSKPRVEIDKKIFFSYWCVQATGGDWTVAKGTILDKILDSVPATKTAKAFVEPFIKESILALKKGEVRCFTHSAWKKKGFRVGLPTAKPHVYLKVLEGGKVISKGDWECGEDVVVDLPVSLCNRPDSLAPGGEGMDGNKSDKADSFIACFEWGKNKTSDKEIRVLFVANGKVSDAAKAAAEDKKVKVGSAQACDKQPQS